MCLNTYSFGASIAVVRYKCICSSEQLLMPVASAIAHALARILEVFISRFCLNLIPIINNCVFLIAILKGN